MIIKHNDATQNRPEGERIIDAPGVLIDIHSFIIQIKTEEAWHKNDRNSITVFKTGQMRIVVGALKQGAEMRHEAEGVMSIQVLEGTLAVDAAEVSSLLYPGNMVVIHKGCNYRIVAEEEAIYLLTISDVN